MLPTENLDQNARLTAAEQKLLRVLLATANGLCTFKLLIQGAQLSNRTALTVLICRLRGKGFDIVSRRGLGYQLIGKPSEQEMLLLFADSLPYIGSKYQELGGGISTVIAVCRDEGERVLRVVYKRNPDDPSEIARSCRLTYFKGHVNTTKGVKKRFTLVQLPDSLAPSMVISAEPFAIQPAKACYEAPDDSPHVCHQKDPAALEPLSAMGVGA